MALVGKQLSLLEDRGGFKQVLNKLKSHMQQLSTSDTCLMLTVCAKFQLRDEDFAKLSLTKLDLMDTNQLTNMAFALHRLNFSNEFRRVTSAIECRSKAGGLNFHHFVEVMNTLIF